MAVHRKLDQRRVYLCAVGLRKRVSKLFIRVPDVVEGRKDYPHDPVLRRDTATL